MKDPYQILGVKKSASNVDIKKAYHRLAKELHPDLNSGDKIIEQKFKDVVGAYDLLSEPDKRSRYNRGELNADGSERSTSRFHNAHASAGSGGFDFRDSGVDVSEVFSELFGGRRGGWQWSTATKGQDVNLTFRLSFLDAANGIGRRIKLKDGKSLDVNIPPGTEDGSVLRLKGQGLSGQGNRNFGDVLIEVQVDPHQQFVKEGLNIYLELPVTLSEAIIGARISVPTIGKAVKVKIPAGSNTGTKLRLKGKGITDSKGSRIGDQFVTLKVVLPEKPDDDLTKFVGEWSKKHDYKVRRDGRLN